MFLHNLLEFPLVYKGVQRLFGSSSARMMTFCHKYIRPFPGMRILDIGCGPADILDVLPDDISYTGFDSNAKDIEYAKMKKTNKDIRDITLLNWTVQEADFTDTPLFDLVMAHGVLHHLDDTGVKYLVDLAASTLKPGGRLVTLDCCLVNGQNPLAKFLITHDRGKFPRSAEGYLSLLHKKFSDVQHTIVEKRSFPPYTYIIIEATSSHLFRRDQHT